MRDLFDALKTLERYGLLPEKRGQRITRESVAIALSGGGNGKRTRSPVTDAEITTAIKMRNKGATWNEVQAATGRSPSVLAKHMD